MFAKRTLTLPIAYLKDLNELLDELFSSFQDKCTDEMLRNPQDSTFLFTTECSLRTKLEEEEEESDEEEEEEEEEEKGAAEEKNEVPAPNPKLYWTQEDLDEIIRLTRLHPQYRTEKGESNNCVPKNLKKPSKCAFCKKRLSANALAKLWELENHRDDDILTRKYNSDYTCAWKRNEIEKREAARFLPFKIKL